MGGSHGVTDRGASSAIYLKPDVMVRMVSSWVVLMVSPIAFVWSRREGHDGSHGVIMGGSHGVNDLICLKPQGRT